MKRTGLLLLAILFLTAIPVAAQTVQENTKNAKASLKTLLKSKALPPGNLSGAWWRVPANVQLFSLTADQQKRMDEVFQEARVRLITVDADLRVQEALLEPLMAAERLDETKTLAQIDRVAQARAELEKANARMLLGIRQALTPEQWSILQKRQSKLKP
jgi:Spy/CpxP family protein refolding chaperone